MVDVFSMLNQTVQDTSFYNALIRYQIQAKNNFSAENITRLTFRAFTLDKRKVKDMEIPRKRRVVFAKNKRQPGGQSESEEEDDGELELLRAGEFLDKLTIKTIRERKRRFSLRHHKKVDF